MSEAGAAAGAMPESAGQVELYDDFKSPGVDGGPDPARWVIGQMENEGQVLWVWRDENLQPVVGGGRCALDIPVFSLSHDTVGIFDNPKVLYCTKKLWDTSGGALSFRTRLGGIFNGDDKDYRDGFACFHVLDFVTGTVMDVATSGRKFWAIFERLPIPGLVSPVEPFIDFHDLGVDTEPGHMHDVELWYDPATATGRWLVDGEVKLELHVPMRPQSVFLSLGVLTLWPQVDGKSVSCKGQGGTGLFGPVEVVSR
jgi:Family of unknown function (DUF6081)